MFKNKDQNDGAVDLEKNIQNERLNAIHPSIRPACRPSCLISRLSWGPLLALEYMLLHPSPVPHTRTLMVPHPVQGPICLYCNLIHIFLYEQSFNF